MDGCQWRVMDVKVDFRGGGWVCACIWRECSWRIEVGGMIAGTERGCIGRMDIDIGIGTESGCSGRMDMDIDIRFHIGIGIGIRHVKDRLWGTIIGK